MAPEKCILGPNPSVALAAFRSEVVVLFCFLFAAPIVYGGSVFGSCFVMKYLVSVLGLQSS